MWLKKLVLFVWVLILTGSCLTELAYGKDFPTKPIEVIVGHTAGSPLDMVSRLVGDIAPKYLGQPVVVVDKPGAGGSIAAAEIISSSPDGYKLFTTTNFFFATTSKTQTLPFDPYHLVPLVNFVQFTEGIFVRGESPWRTFKEVLDYARANPGKLRWAHTGRGIAGHVTVSFIFKKAGVETIEVPYKGSPEKLAALLGGHVDLSSFTYGAVKDHLKTGNVRILALISDRRSMHADLSNAPTVIELGFPEISKITALVGFYLHKDTPGGIKKTLIDAFKKTYNDPAFKNGIEKTGDEMRFGEPEFMKEAIMKSEEFTVPMLKELGLYVGK